MAKKLLLIDGNNLFHRAYHALPPLTDKSGENANAVYGFSNMLLKAVSEVEPDYVACAFDTAAPTFRHIEFEKYKAQRPAPPPDLYPQLPKVKKVLDAFGVPYFEKAGYEADDILATIASKAITTLVIASEAKQSGKGIASSSTIPRNDKVEVVILSGDRDCLQLVDGAIKVQMPGWNLPAGKAGLATTTLFGAAEVREKYGVTPEQMVDYKSLVGDVSDNVPGVAGIGPKTASSLLQKYGSVEEIYRHIDDILGSTKDKLLAGKELAMAAAKLVELDRDVHIDLDITKLEYKPDWEKVRREFESLGFKSILNKLPGAKVDEVKGTNNKAPSDDKNQLELI
ncbi:MAG: 5'-3' exonuclease H3TH domain-containing protein [Candidatus Curtissbacteria bacterium]|nr:5'-3' exonuclease H3TH domain-containing protein [Candidatus Curtissbacteria bacterium]